MDSLTQTCDGAHGPVRESNPSPNFGDSFWFLLAVRQKGPGRPTFAPMSGFLDGSACFKGAPPKKILGFSSGCLLTATKTGVPSKQK